MSNISEVQSSILSELSSLAFVKDNAKRLMERKVSFERTRDKRPTVRPRATGEQVPLTPPSDWSRSVLPNPGPQGPPAWHVLDVSLLTHT